MEYVDKNKSRQWAHELIQDVLKSWLEEFGKYPDDLFAAFQQKTDVKERFRKQLLEDSCSRCCYCMRDIKGTTLEHMIPQSVEKDDELKKYFESESNLDKENIILEKKFKKELKGAPPYPHTLAYENLIPSCFGNLPSGAKCCNNYRGDKFIEPLVFRPNIHEEVRYKSNGDIVWIKEKADTEIPTISKLGLDCLELKAIRHIWFYLVTHNMGSEEKNMHQTIDDLLFELGKPKSFQEKNMQQMLMNFKRLDYWHLVEKYSYFNNRDIFEK